MCNKMAFDTKAIARKHVKQMRLGIKFRSKAYKRGGLKERKLVPYECPECGKFHLTSTGHLKGKKLKTRNKQLEKANAGS